MENVVRICLVGDEGTGKTSLGLAFQDEGNALISPTTTTETFSKSTGNGMES